MAPESAESYLVEFSRQAMACKFAIYLHADGRSHSSPAAVAALDLIEELEAQLTVYRPTSEVMRINREAAGGPVEVEPGLFELLSQAVELCRETEGAYDVAAGALSKVWGFFRRQGAVPLEADLTDALARVGSQFLDLDAARRTIAFRRAGIELNLGSIGKGYALDRAVSLLADAGVTDFLFHGGQSSVVARGSAAPGDPHNTGWIVGVRDPLRPKRRLAEIRLTDQALGTSGSGTQFFRHQGRRYGHILDPRTGRPAEGVHSATVVAPAAAQADALSTAFYSMGPEKAADHCRRHPEIGMLLVVPGAKPGTIEVVVEGLPESSLTIPVAP